MLLALLACSAPPEAPNPDAFDERIGEDADLTPVALAVEELLANGERVPNVAELAATVGEAPPPSSEYDFTPPETIRVWRSSRGGSSSCSGDVEVIAFEDYVKGVLPHEWIRSWETESLRAGAVAIRSYAAWWVNAGGKYTCADICDTTSCQVYDDATYSNTDDAVDDTEGEYVVEGRDLVFAEFSAENGDPTAYGVSDAYCSGEAVFGHGRGVCQWGSQRWALYGGKEHTWIVEHYYPGSAVVVVGVDEDGDGYESDDCDDRDPTIHPGATETCDHEDDDCDGHIDESDASDAQDWYRDADGDGYGDPDDVEHACWPEDDQVLDDSDCDDTNARINPAALELCDAVDNDCDAALDEGYDADADGYRTCDGDCADTDPARHPGLPDGLDGVDNDCDWRVDEGTTAYDDDGDGWTEGDGDCDDTDTFTFPVAPESADGEDDDCDGLIDEDTEVSDDDGDAWAEVDGDCDDADAAAHPEADERVNDRDDDCDGIVDDGTIARDDDGDGWTEAAGDCDDAAASSFPGAVELPDGRDGDCDGRIDEGTPLADDDLDGWTGLAGDCDDLDATVFPEAIEVVDGRDQDCDTIVDDHTVVFDDDHDGWTEGAGDCDDADPGAFPGAPERIDGGDENCDGRVDDGTDAWDDDQDGWTEAEHDCDDTDGEIFPGAVERVNDRDDDCDGVADDETEIADDDGDGWTELAGDCDDGDAHTFPGAFERIDGRDGDCDGEVEVVEGWGCASAGAPSVLGVLIAVVGVRRRSRQNTAAGA